MALYESWAFIGVIGKQDFVEQKKGNGEGTATVTMTLPRPVDPPPAPTVVNINDINLDKTILGGNDLIRFDTNFGLNIEPKVPKIYNLLVRVTRNIFIERARVYYLTNADKIESS